MSEQFIGLAQKLVEDAKLYARAQFAFYRSLAGERAREAWLAGTLFAIAAGVANATLIAVLLGVMMLLGRWIGILPAIIVILLVGLMLVATLFFIGFLVARRVGRPIKPEDE